MFASTAGGGGGGFPEETLIWSGTIYQPYDLSFQIEASLFRRNESNPGALYDFGLKELDGVTKRLLPPGLTHLVLPDYSWYSPAAAVLGGGPRILSCHYDQDTLDAQDMDPTDVIDMSGDGGPALTANDRQIIMWVPPLDQSDLTAPPFWNGGALQISHVASLNLDTAGLETPPSAWTAGGSMVVSGGSNDTWAIHAAGDSVIRNLTTRYYTQMGLLAGGVVTGWAWNPLWPIWLKANLAQIDVTSITDATLQAALTAPEDITNYSNFSYLRLTLPGAYNGRFVVTLTYSTVTFYDPNYTDNSQYAAGGGFGDPFSWTRNSGQVATYSSDRDGKPLTLTDALRQFDVDLFCDDEATHPTLLHVDSVQIAFLDAPVGDSQSVALETCALFLSDRVSPIDESHHFFVSFKSAWDFFYQKNYFGLRWNSDGLPQSQHDFYGNGCFQNEPGLEYVTRVNHAPLYEGPFEDLSTAKPLSQLADEINRQEGILAAYSQDAVDAHTKDANGDTIGSPAWWWILTDAELEMRTAEDPGGLQQLQLEIGVGSIDITHLRWPITFYVYDSRDGKIDGIATRGGIRARLAGPANSYYEDTNPAYYGAAEAGTTLANGEYAPTGTSDVNGNPVFANGTYFMGMVAGGMGNSWYINPTDMSSTGAWATGALYQLVPTNDGLVITGSPTGPTSGTWTVVGDAPVPAPTFTAGPPITPWTFLGSTKTDAHGRGCSLNGSEDGTHGHIHDRSRHYAIGAIPPPPDGNTGVDLGPAVSRSYCWQCFLISATPNLFAVQHFTDMLIVSDVNLFADCGWHRVLRGGQWQPRVVLSEAQPDWANLWLSRATQEWAESSAGVLETRLARGLRSSTVDDPVSLGAYDAHAAVGFMGRLYVAAYAGGNHYLLRFQDQGTHAAETYSPVNLIAAGEHQPAGLAVSPRTWQLFAAVPLVGGGVQLYTSLDSGKSWHSLATAPGLAYPALTTFDGYLWLLGYNPVATGGATGQLLAYQYRIDGTTITTLQSAVLVGASDNGRPALVIDGSSRALTAVAPKVHDWTAPNPTPGLAEYQSVDSGKTWKLIAVHDA